jgi:large conductance mechanosensitive channel
VLKEFRDFMSRGNVVDLAVAVIIGAAFGRIVTTLVDGVIMPPLGLMLGQVDFSSLFIVLDPSAAPPASLADAKANGIPVIAYGQLINDIVTFFIVGLAVFTLVRQANRLKSAPAAAPASTKECPLCATAIPIKASRCPNCTSPLEVAGIR